MFPRTTILPIPKGGRDARIGRPDETPVQLSFPEQRVRADHPLRAIRTMTDRVFAELSPRFTAMYSTIGRPSIPPEQLLRALLIQSLYTVRSERLLMEEIDYSVLYLVVGLSMDEPIWSPTTFSKNRATPELHSAPIILKRLEKPSQVLDRGLVTLEAGTAALHLVGTGERVDATFEDIDVGLGDLSLVREIVKELQAEFETGRGTLRRRLRDLYGRRAVKRAVDFNGVESLSAICELVELGLGAGGRLSLPQRVKHPGPWTVTRRRVVPAAGPDANLMRALVPHS